MVKSSVRAMPKPRRKLVEITPEFLREFEELKRRMEETDKRIEVTLAMADEAQRKLRLLRAKYR